MAVSFGLRQKYKKALLEQRKRLCASGVVSSAQLHINRKYNNLVFTLTFPSGLVLQAGSSGLVKFKKRKKLTPQAAEALARKFGEFARFLGVSLIELVVRIRLNIFTYSAIRGLEMHGLKVVMIRSKRALPHNGCRQRKRRRV